MNARILEAEGLSAGYGSVPAIADLSLHLEPGERVALLGANGAGKTTTLLVLAGSLRPTSGKVTMFGSGRRSSLARRIRDGLCLLPEHRAVFRTLTTRENLLLGRGGVDAALELFPELKTRLSVPAGLLSGGEQQMLALGRILAARPKLILADELSLGLAPLVVRRLLQALTEAAEQGAAVLIVEQHPRVALGWADRGYVMRRGRLEMSGSSPELIERMDEVSALYL